MAKETKMMSVLTLPIKTEPWQADVLQKRFECCRKVYNAMLGKKLKDFRKMNREPEYVNALKVIYACYKKPEKEQKAYRKSEEYKNAVEAQKKYLKEYRFSEFDFISDAGACAKIYKENIPSATVGSSIAKPMWAAFQKLLFGNGNIVHYKKYNNWKSIASDGKSGLRIVNERGETVLQRTDEEKLWVLFGTKGNKILKMPIKLDKKDVYALEMLDKRIKVVRVTRKCVRGTYKYYVQLTLQGPPAIKYDKEGNEKNPVGKGKVGIYIDTTSITIYKEGAFTTIRLGEGQKDYSEEKAKVSRLMDKSRRTMNPDNFNSDGTIKKGIMKDGQRVPLTWKVSNNYKKNRNRLIELNRLEREARELQMQKIVNQVMAMGDSFVINDYPFQYAAMRKKETEQTASGETTSKKKAGKTIGKNAPATFVVLLNQKLVSRGYPGVDKKRLMDVNTSEEGYRKYYAKAMCD